jgi:hypothetical protein
MAVFETLLGRFELIAGHVGQSLPGIDHLGGEFSPVDGEFTPTTD